MVFDAAFWATIALFLFIGVIVYLKVPGMITKALDNRIKAIEAELAEAERLRLEAKFLLEEYESKREAATKEFRLTAEAKTSLEALITRRTKAVEDKIAQAESQAIAEVRSRSADVAVEAARVLLTKQMAKKGDALVDQAIRDVGAKLN
jgi:F-type H+-transporting ATPase subunit b